MSNATILVGDVRQRLSELPDGAVRCVVTSPPYWGLRDYGHDGQLGLEQTPEQYVAGMVEVFREVRRVLANDGTLWLNIGDSYSSGNRTRKVVPTIRRSDFDPASGLQARLNGIAVRPPVVEGLGQKQLVGIPWRLAFALQADGWLLRQDIIWAKPNPMPESVTDRCTKAHEYLFLLTKQPRYYYDHKVIKEPVSEVSLKRAEYGWDSDRPSTKNASMGGAGIHVEKMGTRFVNPEDRNKRSVWTVTTKPFRGAHFAVMPEALVEPCILAGSAPGDTVLDPFSGSGTVGVVALRNGRDYIGTELNPEYAQISEARIRGDQPLLNTVEVK